MNIKIIGLGGIGTVFSELVTRYLTYSGINNISICFIDGDSFERKNSERQIFQNLGNKAEIKFREINNPMGSINYTYIPEYINENNINRIIFEDDIVFLCVDNHATRKLVSDHCVLLRNIILISGGNELLDGNVQIFIRKDNKNITPTITDYHPEINEPLDKNPNDMSCEELSRLSEPQIFFTNAGVAIFMCFSFYNILNQKDFNVSEVYFDIPKLVSDSKIRSPYVRKHA